MFWFVHIMSVFPKPVRAGIIVLVGVLLLIGLVRLVMRIWDLLPFT